MRYCQEKMNIGIFFPEKKEGSGVYHYSVSFIQALKKTKLKDKFFLFSSPNVLKKEKELLKKKANWKIIDLEGKKTKLFKIRRLIGSIYDKHFAYPLPRSRKKSLVSEKKIDFMLYPNVVSFAEPFKEKIPYLVCVHDLQHRLNPQFPEVSKKGERKRREYLYQNYLKKALLVISESETGKKVIQKFYSIKPAKIKVLPYAVSQYCLEKLNQADLDKIRKKYSLKSGQFIFYPAQFWPHKNHKQIVKALAWLRKKGVIIETIFAGREVEKWGEHQRVMKLARDLGVRRQIKNLGFVKDKELIAFYKSALCLLMPTFFGPSNIPPLEAFYLGCPVITSDIEGIRQQVGGAAILVDPKNHKQIGKAVLKIYQDSKYREELIRRGKKRARENLPEKFSQDLEKIIKQAKEMVSH